MADTTMQTIGAGLIKARVASPATLTLTETIGVTYTIVT